MANFEAVFLLVVSSLLLVNSHLTPYDEKYFDQTIDHFNFFSYADKTFKQRYLVQDKWWSPQGKGPIFFYTGNEGAIDEFWDNTGFVFDIAPQFGALVVFAEHRFYGKSLPFGNKSFKQPGISLLTIEQALADYAVLIDSLQEPCRKAGRQCPVITFGGSYGGMLSAYMRFKYPSLVTGSIAASAPIYLLTSDLDRNFFFEGVTRDFNDCQCEGPIRKAFILMNDMAAQGPAGLKKLSTLFNLCSPLKSADDYTHLLGWIRNSLSMIAMMDYPYATDFMGKLPANPVNASCGYVLSAGDVVSGLAQAAGLLYNGTAGHLKCFDIFTEFIPCADPSGCGVGPSGLAWDYQACTEVWLNYGSNNKTDMFPVLPWTPEMRRDYCMKTWKVTPRNRWASVEFWGRNIKSASNIVFSNGDLDPWMGGGVLSAPNPSIKTVIIKGGAHHLDLRGHNVKDPISVIEAREVEKSAIRHWIN